jgi:2-methylcitrate dehydratase PrpD
VAAFHGADALLPHTAASLHSPRAVTLADRVVMAVDPEMDNRFPTQTPARVIVRTGSERIEKIVLTPRGDPANPLSRRDLEEKFFRLTSEASPPGFAQKVIDAIAHFAGNGFSALQQLLDFS